MYDHIALRMCLLACLLACNHDTLQHVCMFSCFHACMLACLHACMLAWLISRCRPEAEWTPEDGTKEDLADRMAKFLCDKAAMLDEYFGVVISEVTISASD